MSDLRLVIFDVDGTLVDSRGMVLASMAAAYESIGAAMPPAETLMQQVGRSLDLIFPAVSPELSTQDHAALSAGYRDAFQRLRAKGHGEQVSPLFPGTAEVLEALSQQPETLLGIATGKSMRGWRVLEDMHGWSGRFLTVQTADHHPSKPHPSMVETCLKDTGVDAARAIMVGDTTFDMDMARAASVRSVGVTWGNHTPEMLDADHVISEFGALLDIVDSLG